MMNRKAASIIDSDAIFALLSNSDTHHLRVVQTKKNHRNCRYYISHFVIGETATVLSRKISKAVADSFLQGVPNQQFQMVPADEKLMNLAVDFFLRQVTKDTSFVDCVNMAVAKRLGIDTIFSFDKVYERNGFKLLH